MPDYLSQEKVCEVLKGKLIEYQKRFLPDDDFGEQFEINVVPSSLSPLNIDDVITNLKKYAKNAYAINPFSFFVKDQKRNKVIFRIIQSRSNYFPAWELHDLT